MNFPGHFFLRNLVERRALIYQMVRRDFHQRYVGSIAGWLWSFIHPIVLLLCWTFVFQVCMKIELPRGEVTQNYTFFLLSGFLPWLLFQETVQRSATAITDQANLLTKTLFPSEIIPVSLFFSSLLNHVITLTVVVAGVAWWLGHWGANLVFLPLLILLTGLFAVGVSWIASSLHVYLRDTAQVMTIILTFWFWLTPIMIFEKDYPERFQFLLDYNPLAFLVRAYRDSILSNRVPDWEEVGILAAWSVTIFCVGGLFFRQLKRGFADVL